MEYRQLGKTGLKVSLMGFGGIPIQRVSREEARDVLNLALEQGVNFIDSARAYTDSESKISQVLKGKRDKVILATKTAPRMGQDMAAEIDTSLANFATDYIDLYQCHNVKAQHVDVVMAPGGALEALLDAKKAGKIRHIGMTTHHPSVLIELLKTGYIETVQVPYNFIERSVEDELLGKILEMNLGFIVMKPLAGGAFSKPELALKYLMALKGISTLIPGMDSKEQVIQNTNLAKKPVPLTPAELTYLEEEAEKVGESFCRRCDYCKPCPQGVDISTAFLLNGYYERYNMLEWSRLRYGGLKVKADACEDCGLCETRCPYSLPIRKMLKKAHANLG